MMSLKCENFSCNSDSLKREQTTQRCFLFFYANKEYYVLGRDLVLAIIPYGCHVDLGCVEYIRNCPLMFHK